MKKIFAKLISFLPSGVKNFIKFLYWKYLKNFKRYKLSKKYNFNSSNQKQFEKILKNFKENGLVISKGDQVFKKDELDLLKQIKITAEKEVLNLNYKKTKDEYDDEINELKNKGVFKPFRYNLGGYLNFKEKKINSETLNDFHYNILKIGLKEEFIDFAIKYLGIYPFLGRFYCWYDFPNHQYEQPVSTQCWHKDSDDIRFFKIFIYLNKIESDNGPFSFVKKTHLNNVDENKIRHLKKTTKFNSFKTLSDQDILNLFPKENVTECIGDFSTTIFADTSGYHKGKTLEKNKRLMLVYEYFSETSNYYYELKLNNKIRNSLNEKQLFAIQKA